MELLRVFGIALPLALSAAAGPGDTSVRSAVEAHRLVLLRSSRGLEDTAGEGWSGKLAQRRKAAYARLHALGVALPEPRNGQCATWVSQGTCGHPLFVCAVEGEIAGPGGRTRGKMLRVSARRARSFFTSEEVANLKDMAMPRVQEMEGPVGGALGNYASWVSRDEVVEIPIAESGASRSLDCRVLYADGCAGLVGVACRAAGEPGPPKLAHRPRGGSRTLIAEYYLAPPLPDAFTDAAYETP